MSVKYSRLLEEFLLVAQCNIDVETLKTIKEYYAGCIDSNRKLSYIKDLSALLIILEKRDILSCDNIKPLHYISKNYIRDAHLERKLEKYEVCLHQLMQYSQIYNMYQDKNVPSAAPLTEKASNSNAELSNPTTSLKNKRTLEQIVVSEVSEKIGRSWRDVARHLGILESQIDAIQNKYPFNLKEQSYEALKNYIGQCNTDRWKLDLIRALEKGRRRDLKEIVEELLMKS